MVVHWLCNWSTTLHPATWKATRPLAASNSVLSRKNFIIKLLYGPHRGWLGSETISGPTSVARCQTHGQIVPSRERVRSPGSPQSKQDKLHVEIRLRTGINVQIMDSGPKKESGET